MKEALDRVTLRFLAPPAAGGRSGAVGAGQVLEWIDRAAYACTATWSGAHCVTAYVGNVRFRRPVLVGDLVDVAARIISTGRTSMQVLVTVRSKPSTGGSFAFATSGLVVMVAVDDQLRPQTVPMWRPRSIAELDLEDRARRRLSIRNQIRDLMQSAQFTNAGSTPDMQLRFLVGPRDVERGGSVEGGTVMRWLDEAAQACATMWAGQPTVAVYAGGIQFHHPVAVSDLVEVHARVIHSTPRSLHVATRVRAASPLELQRTDAPFRVTTESMTIAVVALDGSAGPVPQIEPRTEEDLELNRLARRLVALRAKLDEIGVDE